MTRYTRLLVKSPYYTVLIYFRLDWINTKRLARTWDKSQLLKGPRHSVKAETVRWVALLIQPKIVLLIIHQISLILLFDFPTIHSTSRITHLGPAVDKVPFTLGILQTELVPDLGILERVVPQEWVNVHQLRNDPFQNAQIVWLVLSTPEIVISKNSGNKSRNSSYNTSCGSSIFNFLLEILNFKSQNNHDFELSLCLTSLSQRLWLPLQATC